MACRLGRSARWGLGTVVAIALGAGTLTAQTTVVGDARVAWDQAAPDLAVATGYAYDLYLNGEYSGRLAALCNGAASPFQCEAQLPPIAPGLYILSITASTRIHLEPWLIEYWLPSPPSAPLLIMVL